MTPMRPGWDTLRVILAAGIQAPSADNRHGLRYAVDADRVRLVATDRTSWASLPHRRMLAEMASGAVIENIVLKSLEFGLAVELDLHRDPAQPDVVATLQWSAAAPGAGDPLSGAIATRHTNRRFYRRERVDASALKHLTQAAASIEGAELRWLDAPDLRACALRAIRLAETERFRRPALHAELFGAVRFDVGWQRTVDEGLPPAALEVESPARAVFAMLREWRVMRVANLFGAHLALGLRAGFLPCATAPHLGLVSACAGDDHSGALRAGRAFQRVWLAADAAGLALQPMAASTALARQVPGNGWVCAPTHAKLQALLEVMRAGARAEPYMLFRIGRARAPSGVAARKPLHSYVS